MEADNDRDYERGYWQAVRDIWFLLMEIGNANSATIQPRIRDLIDRFREVDKND